MLIITTGYVFRSKKNFQLSVKVIQDFFGFPLLCYVSGPEKSCTVLTSRPRAKFFPFRPDQTQSMSIISTYGHNVLKIRKICFNLNMTR